VSLARRPGSVVNDAESAAFSVQAAQPLWRSVPKRDEAGRLLNDFMMLAPGLKALPGNEVETVIRRIRSVLERFPDLVVFANFNVALNLLWVSLRCRQGGMSLVVFALRAEVPMLKLVGHLPLERSE